MPRITKAQKIEAIEATPVEMLIKMAKEILNYPHHNNTWLLCIIMDTLQVKLGREEFDKIFLPSSVV